MIENMIFLFLSFVAFLLFGNESKVIALGKNLKKISPEKHLRKRDFINFVRNLNKKTPINFELRKEYGIVTLIRKNYKLDFFIYWDEDYKYYFEEKDNRIRYSVKKVKK